MKRILFLAVAMILVSLPAYGQSVYVVDIEGIKKDMAQSDKDIADPKKASRPYTWRTRGKIMYMAGTAAGADLYDGFPLLTFRQLKGQYPVSGRQTIKGNTYDVYDYKYFDAYVLNEKLEYWKEKLVIDDDALRKAEEAYTKLAEISKSRSDQEVARNEIASIGEYYKSKARNSLFFDELLDAAKYYKKAYEVQLNPLVNKIDTVRMYNAGYIYVTQKMYDEGIDALEQACKYGYLSDGDTQYYLGYAYIMTKQFEKAKELLYAAMKQFPSNKKLNEALLYYYSESGDNKEEILPLLEKNAEADPNDPTTWLGLAVTYNNMGEKDKAINAFKKTIELRPNDAAANYYLGELYAEMGNELSKQVYNTDAPISVEEYKAKQEEIKNFYLQALPFLEKSFAILPNERATVALLKNLTFYLRDKDENMAAKYQQYNDLYEEMTNVDSEN